MQTTLTCANRVRASPVSNGTSVITITGSCSLPSNQYKASIAGVGSLGTECIRHRSVGKESNATILKRRRKVTHMACIMKMIKEAMMQLL